MDSKNVIAAIALSSAVIVLYSLFFAPDQTTTKQNLTEKKKNWTKYWYAKLGWKTNFSSNFKRGCFKRK